MAPKLFSILCSSLNSLLNLMKIYFFIHFDDLYIGSTTVCLQTMPFVLFSVKLNKSTMSIKLYPQHKKYSLPPEYSLPRTYM